MRTIAYPLIWSATWGGGILPKVLAQLRSWRAAGCDARLFMLTYQPDALERVRRIDPDAPVTVHYAPTAASRLAGFGALVREITAWGPDMVYQRFSILYPSMPALARRFPTVLEVNTDDLGEQQLASPARALFNRLTRGVMLGHARALLFVSGELAGRPHFARFRKPYAVLGNGVDLARYPRLPPAANHTPRLAFIGSPGEPWHGVEKIVALARQCPEWSFDLVGVGARELGDAPANLRTHGYLDRPGYEPIFAAADVAIGTLGLHLRHMDEASPLKVREYLAFGLPTIIGYRDTDFPQPQPFLLQLPNSPDNISAHLGEIRAFVERWRGVRVPREAVAHLDSTVKERRRLAFFQAVTS